MAISTRIYAGGAFSFGEQLAVDNLKQGAYSAVIVWAVHVQADGTLVLNDTQIVKDGVYHEAQEMNLPSRLAELYNTGVEVIFSIGGWGVQDFSNIQTLLDGGVPTQGNPLYDNFAALKAAMVNGGGDINAIDFDNEDNLNAQVMTNFALMLGNIGYSITFCPYGSINVWKDTYQSIKSAGQNNLVTAIHLQCYSGGAYQNPNDWGQMIQEVGGNALLIPGLATNQAQPGPWWDGSTNQPGGSVVQKPGVAMYGQADWSNELRRGNYATADEAIKSANGAETFFFYCNGYMDLGPGKVFQKGDAVFFGGVPWWGSAPQCDGYSLSGGCSNIYNNNGACPSDLQSQYAVWKVEQYPPQGGFIWMYDSIVNCVLSGPCGELGKTTGEVANEYQQAIVNGLS